MWPLTSQKLRKGCLEDSTARNQLEAELGTNCCSLGGVRCLYTAACFVQSRAVQSIVQSSPKSRFYKDPHLCKFGVICKTNEYCIVFCPSFIQVWPHLHRLHNVSLSFTRSSARVNIICTLSSITSLHEHALANKCSSSTWLCSMLIVSGSFPTELADVYPVQVFFFWHPKLPTWLTSYVRYSEPSAYMSCMLVTCMEFSTSNIHRNYSYYSHLPHSYTKTYRNAPHFSR